MSTEKFVEELENFLANNSCAEDVFIYHDGKRSHYTGSSWVSEDGYNPRDVSKYMNGVVNMTFEGAFYEIINDYWDFEELLKNHGLWYELGNAWNMAIYKDE